MENLIAEFLKKSHDHERTVESVKKQIRDLQDQGNGNIWLVLDGDKTLGYYFAEILPTEYESKVCLVHQLYLMSSKKSTLQKIDSHLESWAKKQGASELAFFTRRNPKAFLRSLKNGWQVDSVVLKRKIA